jgi:hypothetical protein
MESSWNLKTLLPILIGCFFIAVAVERFVERIPAKSELRKVEGIVDEIKSMATSEKDITTSTAMIVLEGSRVGYQYLDWFPNLAAVYALRRGDRVQILCDRQQKPWIWALSMGDDWEIMSYEKMVAARDADKESDALTACVFGFGGLVSAYGIYKAWRRRRQPPETVSAA